MKSSVSWIDFKRQERSRTNLKAEDQEQDSNRTAIIRKGQRNPARSARNLAKQHVIDKSTVHRILKNDLKVFPYKEAKEQLLTDQIKAKRLAKCWEMKRLVAGRKHMQIQDFHCETSESLRITFKKLSKDCERLNKPLPKVHHGLFLLFVFLSLWLP